MSRNLARSTQFSHVVKEWLAPLSRRRSLAIVAFLLLLLPVALINPFLGGILGVNAQSTGENIIQYQFETETEVGWAISSSGVRTAVDCSAAC
jgi:hypothetical protein